MVWEKNLVPTADDMKEIEEREYEFEDASDMLARWICNGGEITDDIFEKAYKEISLIFLQSKMVVDNENYRWCIHFKWRPFLDISVIFL